MTPLTIALEEHHCAHCAEPKMFIRVNGGAPICSSLERHTGSSDDAIMLLQRRYDEVELDAADLRKRLAAVNSSCELYERTIVSLQDQLAAASKREGATKPELPRPRTRRNGGR